MDVIAWFSGCPKALAQPLLELARLGMPFVPACLSVLFRCDAVVSVPTCRGDCVAYVADDANNDLSLSLSSSSSHCYSCCYCHFSLLLQLRLPQPRPLRLTLPLLLLITIVCGAIACHVLLPVVLLCQPWLARVHAS